MGSEDGIVRLYNGPCKSRATINFIMNVAGGPIISIDISNDEKWILATCPFYLCVFNVYAQSARNLGFVKNVGNDKPPLTRLTIQPVHQEMIANKYGGIIPHFSPVKFQKNRGNVESIVASIGTCLVCWDFRRIEQGLLSEYSIKFSGEETIIENQPSSSHNDILFMTDNNVTVIERNVKK